MITSNQASVIGKLMQARTALVGELSQANADLLRTLQLASGFDILRMKGPRSLEDVRNESDADRKIASIRTVIDGLESDLAQVDRQMENAMNQESQQ